MFLSSFKVAPEISLEMLNYDKGQYMGWASQSVLDQTFEELELVDDASTDCSVGVVEETQETDSRIRLISNPRNRGPAASLNAGLSASTGRIVTFLGPDDLFSSDRT